MTVNDGGPAFPRSDSGYSITQSGMTLRDWFAGQCMAGQVSHPSNTSVDPADIARDSYTMADMMIEERSK